MGLLFEGKWIDQWYENKHGQFDRAKSQFLSAPESNDIKRYHLIVSNACPWAHRTLIYRVLKGFDKHLDLTIVKPEMLEHGWEMPEDNIFGVKYLYEVYLQSDPHYTGRVTVPVLWDLKNKKIVNNESSQIIRFLNNHFNNDADYPELDLYKDSQRNEIDQINELVYGDINNGVYQCGFATSQDAYQHAFKRLFKALDYVEERLKHQRYLVKGGCSEADWRLFTTLIRFDAVYHGHFKCNLRRIEDYPNISHYLRDLYQTSGISSTVHLEECKRHYYFSHTMINPTQIIPLGPMEDFARPHNRQKIPL